MQQKERQTNGSTKQAHKSLYLRFDDRTYVIEGHWKIKSGMHHDNTNQHTLHIASGYHVDFGPIIHLVHPEDVDRVKRTLTSIMKSNVVDFQFRVITTTAHIQTPAGSGTFARDTILQKSQWHEVDRRDAKPRESLKAARQREHERIQLQFVEKSLRASADGVLRIAHATPPHIQNPNIRQQPLEPEASCVEETTMPHDDRYRTLLHLLEDGFASCEVIRNDSGTVIDWHFMDVNPAIEKHTGISATYLFGHRFSETQVHQREWWLDTAARVIRTGQPEKIEHLNTLVNRWEEITILPFGPDQFAMTYHDVSQHKHTDDALQKTKDLQTFMLALTDILTCITDPIEIQYEASRKLARQLDCDNGYYAEMSDDENTLMVSKGYVRDNLPSMAGVYSDKAFTQILALSRDGCLAINDVALSPLLSEHEKAMLKTLKIGALLFVGLFKNGKRVANMAIDQTRPRNWTSFEISLLQETAERTWGILEKNRADDALRRINAKFHTLLHSLSGPLTEHACTNQSHDGQTLHTSKQHQTDNKSCSKDFKIIIERQNTYLHNILNAIPQMIWVLDGHGKITFVNDRWHSYTGLTEERCVDRDARKCNIFHPGQQREVTDKWDYLFAQKKRHVAELMVRDTNGIYRWHLDITEPVLDDHGNIEMLIGSFTDVHEQFASEKESKETRDLLQAVFDASVNSIAIFDAVHDSTATIIDFETRYSNTSAARFLDEQNLPHKSLMQILRKQDTTELFNHFKSVMATAKPFAIDYTINTDGNEQWFHLVAVKLEDGIVITQSDISEQMALRKGLEQLNHSLHEKTMR